MIQMEDSNSINVINDFHVQNTNNEPTWHTVQDNCVSLTRENIERVIKVETDFFDECTWETRIDITKVNDHLEVPSANQNLPENNPDLNDDNINHNQTFSCNICKNKFALLNQLKAHMEKQHTKQTQLDSNSNQCKFCGKQFKLNFLLNRHIEKSHANLTECEICKCIVERSVFNEHIQTHGNDADKKNNSIPNLKLCKLNGVWKSKPSVYTCKICFEKFDSQNNLIEHMKEHEDSDDDIQMQCVNELTDDMQFYSKNQFNCPKCNLRFDNKQILSIHVSHCTKSSQNIWSKFRGQVKTIIQTSYVCTICGNSYTNPLLLKHHITSGCKNRSCKHCGKTFSSKELWSKHMDEFQKYKNCDQFNVNSIETSANILDNQNVIVNDINQSVNNEKSVCTNVLGRNSPNQLDIGTTNSDNSTVQTLSYNVMVNDSGVNVSYENSLCTNVTVCNNSDQTETCTVNSIESMVQGVSQNSIINNCIMAIKKEKNSCSNTLVRSCLDQIEATNSNGSIVQSVSPHNSIVNSRDVNVKKEKISCTNTSKINNFDQIPTANNNESITQTMNSYCLNIKKEKISSMENSMSRNDLECLDQTDEDGSINSTEHVTSQNSIMNYYALNIKKEKCLHQNENENNGSDQLDIVPNKINELNLQTLPEINMVNNIRVKKEPEDNHGSICTVKETQFFSIKRLSSNKNVSSIVSIQNRGQTSNNNMYVCSICKTSSLSVHSFALHMSSHLECSMHECVVCDQKFMTVLLWTNHMTYHQQQVDLNLLNSESSSLEIEPNTNITTDLESLEPLAHSSTLRRRENNSPELNIDFSESQTSNIDEVINRVQKLKKSFKCDICNFIFPSKLSLMNHQTLHDKSRQFSCKFCDRTFSSRGPCTNHEKSHDPNGYKNAVKGMVHQSIEIQNNISIENNQNVNANPILTVRKKKKVLLKSKYCVCYICRKRFAKSCYLTNHLKLRHRINPKSSKEHIANSSNFNDGIGSIYGKKSIDKCAKLELSTELETNSSSSVDKISSNFVNETSYQQSAVIITNANKMYTCQYCNKQFNQKSSHSNHIKCHSNKRYTNNKSVNGTNLNVVKIERNEEHQQEENCISSEFDNSSLIEPYVPNLAMTAVTNHVTTHSDQVLYKCKFCKRQFTLKSSYSNHIKSHSSKKAKRIRNKSLNEVKVEINEVYQQEDNLNISELNNSFIEPNIVHLAKKNRLWFPCDVCEKKFSTPFLLVVHRRSHLGIEPYLCKICDKSYTVRHRWNRHLKSHYWRNKLKNKSKKRTYPSKSDIGTLQPEPVLQQNQLKCGYCKKEYYLISQWKKHLTLSKECRRHCKSSLPEFTTNQARENFSKSTRFECHICKKTYSTSYNRKIHLINVHKLSDVNLETSTSTDVVELKKKMNTENIQQDSKLMIQKKKKRLISNDNSNQCHLCGKCYSNRANLYRHQTISHSIEANVINCTICNRSFKHKYSYREHLRSKHNNLLQKNMRHISFVGKKNRPQIKYKSNIAQYFCKICKVEFSDNVALQNHIKIHTFCQYECKDCGQKFETNVILGEHILNSHCATSSIKLNGNNRSESPTTSSRPINDNLKCKICSRVVKSAWYLPVHMRIHSGARPFKCDVCNMAFRFKPNLRIHKKIHNRPNVSS